MEVLYVVEELSLAVFASLLAQPIDEVAPMRRWSFREALVCQVAQWWSGVQRATSELADERSGD